MLKYTTWASLDANALVVNFVTYRTYKHALIDISLLLIKFSNPIYMCVISRFGKACKIVRTGYTKHGNGWLLPQANSLFFTIKEVIFLTLLKGEKGSLQA
jgi:hypothetical protein